jgi:hypothetical protein
MVFQAVSLDYTTPSSIRGNGLMIRIEPSVQQVAFVDTETGDYGERRINRSDGEAEKFYRDLKLKGESVRIGLEATGHTR